jgi:hypothetical protein
MTRNDHIQLYLTTILSEYHPGFVVTLHVAGEFIVARLREGEIFSHRSLLTVGEAERMGSLIFEPREAE